MLYSITPTADHPVITLSASSLSAAARQWARWAFRRPCRILVQGRRTATYHVDSPTRIRRIT